MKGENTLELKETQSEMIGALEEVNVQEAATEAKRAELQKKAERLVRCEERVAERSCAAH